MMRLPASQFVLLLAAALSLMFPAAAVAQDAVGRPAGNHVMQPMQHDLRLVEQPRVHSMTPTTANVLWTTSLPAMCDIAWGSTPEVENTLTIAANHFGSFSLTGLQPSTKYYFQVRKLAIPSELQSKYALRSTQGQSEVVSFTTPAAAAQPVTYYVSPEGDDASAGSSESQPWRTIAHAAANVNAGDTVLIAQGQYDETIRILATGSPDAPITFKAMPGHKVLITGDHYKLSQGFIAVGKHHLRFDRLYFKYFNAFPLQGWRMQFSGTFTLHESSDIQITRCFDDGRGTYSARFINAWNASNVLVRNSVILNKMSGSMMLWPAPNFRFEHSVIARPMISSFVLRNDVNEPATFTHSIFTDMFFKKAAINATLFVIDAKRKTATFTDNCFYLRGHGLDKRNFVNKTTASQYLATDENISGSIFENPLFAGDKSPPETDGMDEMLHPNNELDFADFFTTNPRLIEKNIGLQRDAFEE